MTSQLAERLGVVTPQIVATPDEVHNLDAAQEAIELADAYGLCDGFPLDESQRFTLMNSLGERADGSWSASTVCDFEPRQNGKNDTCAARELAGLILFGDRLIIHTAHEFPTANEAFLRLVAVFENYDDLRKKVAHIYYANGAQSIVLHSGQRILYKARTGGAGRGFSKADLIVYDEAQHLQRQHVQASAPAKLANLNAQSWIMGSGGFPTSEIAWQHRRHALAGGGGRFAYVEHTAENPELIGTDDAPTIDPLDRDNWAQANPAYNHPGRFGDEGLESLYLELGPAGFTQECLCVWDDDGLAGTTAIDPIVWDSLCDPGAEPAGSVVMGFAVAHDASWSSVAVSDGEVVAVVRNGRGTKWLAAELAELKKKHNVTRIVCVPRGPVGTILADVKRAVTVDELKNDEWQQASMSFAEAVKDGRVTHIGQGELDRCITARTKTSGDSWSWSRDGMDISPLEAVSVARFSATTARPTETPVVAFV